MSALGTEFFFVQWLVSHIYASKIRVAPNKAMVRQNPQGRGE